MKQAGHVTLEYVCRGVHQAESLVGFLRPFVLSHCFVFVFLHAHATTGREAQDFTQWKPESEMRRLRRLFANLLHALVDQDNFEPILRQVTRSIPKPTAMASRLADQFVILQDVQLALCPDLYGQVDC